MQLLWIHSARALCVALSVGWAAAQSSSPPLTDAPLTLAGAIQRARAQHPGLKQIVFELRGQEARKTEAALPPATKAELLVEDAAGTGERQGFSAAQTTLSLGQVIELGGKREFRVLVAEAELARLQTSHAARQLDVLAEVGRRFIDTLHQQNALTIAQEAVGSAERTHAAVARRVQEARSPAAEAARAEVRLAQARLDLENVEHALLSNRYQLAAAMGEREVSFGPSKGELLELPPQVPFEVVARRLESTPEILRFADEARVRDAELRLAQLRARPDIQTQFGVRRYEAGDDIALVAGFSVPLYSGRRAQSAIDFARADRARVDAERDAHLLRVRGQLFAHYQELEHARHEMRALREIIIPQLTEALKQSEHAYERGRYSYLELTDAQRELTVARRRLNDAAAEFHKIRIEIERLTGEDLAPAGVNR